MKIPSISKTGIKLVAVVALFIGSLAFSGCQTMKGAGKDIEKAGDKIQEKASR